MGRRILFACVECGTALVWPVEAEPVESGELTETAFAESLDQHGQATVELHASSRWKTKVAPSGVLTCPDGHTVGVRMMNGEAANTRLRFLRDRVVRREMRGRV